MSAQISLPSLVGASACFSVVFGLMHKWLLAVSDVLYLALVHLVCFRVVS